MWVDPERRILNCISIVTLSLNFLFLNSMIVKHLDALSHKHIVLASQSPRREQLLNLIGIHPRICPSKFAENLSPKDFATAADYAVETAKRKAVDVAAEFHNLWDLIIAADTIVEYYGEVLEKPVDEADAVKTLMQLSGKRHTVYTGVVLLLPSLPEAPLLRTFSTATHVWFDEFDKEEALAYVKTKEPMDKAGSYGIQGFGSMLVKKIDGCYFNVMGLPINALARQLRLLVEEQLL